MARKNNEKPILYPKPSPELAEFIGIMLGDGNIQENIKPGKGIAVYQVRIAFHRAERQYQKHVKKLVFKLFGLLPSIYEQPGAQETVLIYSRKRLVKYLKRAGLVPGNKVHNQCRVPLWVYEHYSYMRACLRGLMDTDGSIYRMGVWHQICFKNMSHALLRDFQQMARACEYYCSEITAHKVYISRRDDIRKFFNEVGVHNKKHEQRYRAIISPVG